MVDEKRPASPPSVRSSSGREVELHQGGQGSRGLIDRAIQSLDGEEMQAIKTEIVREAVRLEVKKRDQDITHEAGKRAVDDHLEAWKMLDGGGKTTRHTVSTETEMGAGKMRIESKSGAQCFVATVAYGNASHPDVTFLRRYRDQVLATTLFGRAFIRVYWFVGPKMASTIRPFPRWRRAVRNMLAKLVKYLERNSEF